MKKNFFKIFFSIILIVNFVHYNAYANFVWQKNKNIGRCKNWDLLYEPLQLERYSISEDYFDKKTKYWKIFIKYLPLLKNKIWLNNYDLLNNFLNSICWKNISYFDKQKIINLYDLLDEYNKLHWEILNNFFQLYKEANNWNINKVKNIANEFKKKYDRIRIIMGNLKKLSIMKFWVNEMNIKNWKNNYAYIKIVPTNKEVLINTISNKNFISKVYEFNLLINKKHLENININNINKIYVLWNITIYNKYQVKINELYTILYK